MIYGGVKYDKISAEKGLCNDPYQSVNCTTVTIPEFATFDSTSYYLYRLTFGNGLNEVIKNK